MSRASEIFNLLRTAYLRLIPRLRPVVSVFVTTTLGGVLLGPTGIVTGATVGALPNFPVVQQCIGTVLAVLQTVWRWVRENPGASAIIVSLLQYLYQYRDALTGGDVLEHHPHEN